MISKFPFRFFSRTCQILPPRPRVPKILNFTNLTDEVSLLSSIVRPCRFTHPSITSYRLYVTSSAVRKAKTDLDFKIYFNDEDIKKILETVNESKTIDDLEVFGFPKKALKVIKAKRKEGVLIESFDDLIDIVGSKMAFKAFSSILDRPSSSGTRNPMFPIPSQDLVEKASSVASITMNANQISCCCIERNADRTLTIKSLQLKELPMGLAKIHFLTNLNEMVEFTKTAIPKASLYIVEEYPSSAPSPQLFVFQLRMMQLKSFFMGSLSAKLDLDQQRIIAIKTIAVARLFHTAIGSERVSGQHVVDNLVVWKPQASLHIEDKIKHLYESKSPTIKEGLAYSILLNLAYWKLTKQYTTDFT